MTQLSRHIREFLLDSLTVRLLPFRFHNDRSTFDKDLGKNLSRRPVFVGQHYDYFEAKWITFPEKFKGGDLQRGFQAKGNAVSEAIRIQ